MSSVSLIYRKLWLYRMLMNVLYTSGYKKRFEKVISVIDAYKPSAVLELCFGDTVIAEHCKKNGIEWRGIDLNAYFVNQARLKGFNATEGNLLETEHFPKADVIVMLGSLYHFHNDAPVLLDRMLKAAGKIIISEPVKNLSDQGNIIGWIAKRSANAGDGRQQFRYNKITLTEMLKTESIKLNFNFKVVDSYKKDCIISIEKNGSN